MAVRIGWLRRGLQGFGLRVEVHGTFSSRLAAVERHKKSTRAGAWSVQRMVRADQRDPASIAQRGHTRPALARGVIGKISSGWRVMAARQGTGRKARILCLPHRPFNPWKDSWVERCEAAILQCSIGLGFAIRAGTPLGLTIGGRFGSMCHEKDLPAPD
jgi:hypothetical protein